MRTGGCPTGRVAHCSSAGASDSPKRPPRTSDFVRDLASVGGQVPLMTKTQYYTATTLDGFIADEHNSLDWLFEVERGTGHESEFDRFFADVGAMAMGRTTYE